MSTKRFTSLLLLLILFTTSIIFGVNSHSNICLILNVISSILLIIEIKNISGNYINISLFFIGFGTLYGLSGPINVLWGEGLHRIFSTPYYIDEFLIAYSIANIGFIGGVIIYNLINNKRLDSKNMGDYFELVTKIQKKLLRVSILLVIIGVIFELINLTRIGGYNVLFGGKAKYQGLYSELSLTLPSEVVLVIAFSILGLYLGIFYKNKKKISSNSKRQIFLLVIASSPFLLINILLGKRGILLSLFLCIFIGITFFKPIKKIKIKLIIILLIVYSFMSFLYANRAIVSLIPEDPSLFIERALSKERLITALNPGNSEFGAAFGNYSEFYRKYDHDFTARFGTTYIKGLVIPIPSFVYPGNKPKQIAYEFRDEFFPSEAKRSSIAGTGFSSILEAYINFKYLGVFVIYLMMGYFLQAVDNKYRYKNLAMMILYISSFSLSRTFHRSSFGGVFGTVFLNLIVITTVVFYIKMSTKSIRNKEIN